jgi:hypothetical protein
VYQDIVERGAIRTSLIPAVPDGDAKEVREGTNRSVLQAFHKHLLKRGLSVKIADRDGETIAALARAVPGRSLREWGPAEIEAAVRAAAALPAGRNDALTGLKRYFQFLVDTERMDYGNARGALDMIKAFK